MWCLLGPLLETVQMQVFRSILLPVFGLRFSSCNVWVTVETPLKSSVVELICRLKPTWENTFQWHLPGHLSFSYNPTFFISKLVFNLVPARVKLNVTIKSRSILNLSFSPSLFQIVKSIIICPLRILLVKMQHWVICWMLLWQRITDPTFQTTRMFTRLVDEEQEFLRLV